MTALQRAIAYVKAGYPYNLAIHKASVDTGVPTKEIAGSFLHRRQTKKTAKEAKAKYQSTIPDWVRKQNEAD